METDEYCTSGNWDMVDSKTCLVRAIGDYQNEIQWTDLPTHLHSLLLAFCEVKLSCSTRVMLSPSQTDSSIPYIFHRRSSFKLLTIVHRRCH